MKTIFRNTRVYENGEFKMQNMLFDGSRLSVFVGEVFPVDTRIVDNTVIIPGLCDVHVHFREPGFSYKETIKTGSSAGARGGYTAVMTMPNLNPTPDTRENLEKQLEIIRRDAQIPTYPYGTITVGQKGEELADLEGMAEDVIGFSDDGRGVQSDEMMLLAMQRAKALGKPIVAHCEVNSLLRGGYIHDGEYAREHGHLGICSESEYLQIERDIELVKKTGVKYHVCHVSAKESVEAIRRAKRDGVDITAETGPHYLILDDSMLEEDGRFKMNPPIRAKEDKEALIEGILDGTIDMIATDHAPHSKEEKSKGLRGSLMGVVGLEVAFPTLYTYLVKPGILSLEALVKLMSDNPRKRFEVKSEAGYAIFALDEERTVNPEEFVTLGRATPFEGMTVMAECLATLSGDGRVYYVSEKIK